MRGQETSPLRPVKSDSYLPLPPWLLFFARRNQGVGLKSVPLQKRRPYETESSTSDECRRGDSDNSSPPRGGRAVRPCASTGRAEADAGGAAVKGASQTVGADG